jgi:hypothetical protein
MSISIDQLDQPLEESPCSQYPERHMENLSAVCGNSEGSRKNGNFGGAACGNYCCPFSYLKFELGLY